MSYVRAVSNRSDVCIDPSTYLEISPFYSRCRRFRRTGAEDLNVTQVDYTKAIELASGRNDGKIPRYAIEGACGRLVHSCKVVSPPVTEGMSSIRYVPTKGSP